MALCPVALVATFADGKTYSIVSKVFMLTGLGALHRGLGYDDGAQWQCPGFWKHRAGRFMGPAGPGLFSLFCLGLPLFPGKAPLAFSNYCDRKMKGLHDPAALSAHPLSL